MKVVEDIDDIKRISRSLRAEGKRIAFVPTMGYLHEGHLSLMRKGKDVGDVLIVSIFVNPTQFGKGEDLEKYPRDMSRDMRLCEDESVDVLFVPKSGDMYPSGYQTYVNVEGVTNNLCGASRPGHFMGVATVVAKLFNIIRPDCAIFGEKDFQQLVVIKRLVTDLNMDVEVIGMPIVRESDGLAMSSRNSYLSSEERRAASNISKALRSADNLFQRGERSAKVLIYVAGKAMESEPMVSLDYIKLVDPETMQDLAEIEESGLLAVAVKIGNTRLIDNIVLRVK